MVLPVALECNLICLSEDEPAAIAAYTPTHSMQQQQHQASPIQLPLTSSPSSSLDIPIPSHSNHVEMGSTRVCYSALYESDIRGKSYPLGRASSNAQLRASSGSSSVLAADSDVLHAQAPPILQQDIGNYSSVGGSDQRSKAGSIVAHSGSSNSGGSSLEGTFVNPAAESELTTETLSAVSDQGERQQAFSSVAHTPNHLPVLSDRGSQNTIDLARSLNRLPFERQFSPGRERLPREGFGGTTPGFSTSALPCHPVEDLAASDADTEDLETAPEMQQLSDTNNGGGGVEEHAAVEDLALAQGTACGW